MTSLRLFINRERSNGLSSVPEDCSNGR